MKLVTYLTPLNERRAGVIAGDEVVDLAAGAAALGCALPSDVVGVLRLGDAGLAVARPPILLEHGVEDSVGNLVGDFIRVALGDRFGSEQIGVRHRKTRAGSRGWQV